MVWGAHTAGAPHKHGAAESAHVLSVSDPQKVRVATALLYVCRAPSSGRTDTAVGRRTVGEPGWNTASGPPPR